MSGALSTLTRGQLGGLAGGCGVLLVIAAFVVVGSFKAVAPSDVCVVQEDGPLDGRGIAQVRQPSGSVAFIGVFNHLCRRRHKVFYADDRVMPTSGRDRRVGLRIGAGRSA